MNRISQFFKKVFSFKKEPEPFKPSTEHFSVPAPTPEVKKEFSFFSRLRFKKRALARKIAANPVKRVGFGTFSRMPRIKGRIVRPLKRAQKRDLAKIGVIIP